MDRCFFCDKIIVPLELMTTEEANYPLTSSRGLNREIQRKS